MATFKITAPCIFKQYFAQINKIEIRSFKHFPPTPKMTPFMPPNREERFLAQLNYTPVVFPEGVEPPVKHPKAWIDMRGPERIHNQLIYKQYGIIALGGGSFRGGHFDVIMNTINRHLDGDKMFAVWRIDPPWKAVSKKSLGKRMGGGKTKVHHYETPVRAGRVIVEVGGYIEFDEFKKVLDNVCQLIPIDAMSISQEMMDELEEEKRKIDEANYNPFKFRECVRRNYSDCRRLMNQYEAKWGGEYF